jgi:hypothetical protein
MRLGAAAERKAFDESREERKVVLVRLRLIRLWQREIRNGAKKVEWRGCDDNRKP